MKFRNVVYKLSSGGARQILRLISSGGTHLDNQPSDINTAVLPPSSRRLSSIRWNHLPLHHRPYISVQTTRPMLGIFRSFRSICRPQDRLFLFLFIFTRHGRQAPGFVTTADFRSTSHTHSSAGRRTQQQAFNEPGPRPSFHRSKAPLASRFGSSAFTAALPAAAQVCSRASSF